MSALQVREIETQDIQPLMDYWYSSDPDFMQNMGVDLSKMPSKEAFRSMIEQQIELPYSEKQSYALIWLYDNTPIGHCNVNEIEFGQTGIMHLHLWTERTRKKGIGSEMVKQSLPYFFKNLHLKTIVSEPFSLNPAPNKTLERIGFILEKEYVTTPGSINFEQRVKRWVLEHDKHEF